MLGKWKMLRTTNIKLRHFTGITSPALTMFVYHMSVQVVDTYKLRSKQPL